MMSLMSSTRKKNIVFLIGIRDLEPLLRLKQLPTTRQVLQRFHHYLYETKSVRNASHQTIDELFHVWTLAAIPTILKKHGIEKLEKIHNIWLLLKKNKGRSSESQSEREINYMMCLDKLFDVAHADALIMMKIKQDQDFLLDQRGGRKMYISTVDKELAKKQERAHQRRNAEKQRQQRTESINVASTSKIQVTDSESSETSNDSDDHEFKPRSAKVKLKTSTGIATPINTCQLFNSDVTSALDRNKTSDREAVRLMVPISSALGHDPSSLPLSRNTISRARKKARKEYSEKAMVEFVPEYPLVLHWDGKILPEIFGTNEVHRLPVLVSGNGEEKLLGVPKVASGTGLNESKAVFNMLEKWKLIEKVEAMSFDTTSVNTGGSNGVCVLLENMIGRELLWLACRHHVMELILAKVFTLCCGPSSSPYIPMFKRFKAAWGGVTQDNFRGLETQPETAGFRQSTLDFLTTISLSENNTWIRDDYQELIELTMIVLGDPPAKIHWRAPGAIHHARWMAKLLYAIKIYLFRDQRDVFNLTKREEAQLHRFVLFGSHLYTKVWIEAPLATEAPGQDLELWFNLGKYKEIDPEISTSARKILERHLWYLSDEAVGLALFSDRVSSMDKTKIVEGMTKEPGERNVRGDANILKEGTRLGDFASKRTRKLLTRVYIGEHFLSIPPDTWNTNEDYIQGKARVRELRVVNDTAERGVKLFADFNRLLTNDEEEKQFLLQVVEANRKAVPTQTSKKSAINALY